MEKTYIKENNKEKGKGKKRRGKGIEMAGAGAVWGKEVPVLLARRLGLRSAGTGTFARRPILLTVVYGVL